MSIHTPTQTPAPDTLARQLRLFKLLAALLAAALAIGMGGFFLLRHLGQPVTIVVGGRPVGTVRNVATANSLIAAAEQAKVGTAFAGEEPVRMQKVHFLPAEPNTPQDPDAVVQARLAQSLTLHVRAFVILVRGRPSLALPTADAATETLRLVKDHWAQAPPEQPVTGQPEILEPIDIARRAVDTRQTRQTPEEAAPYFWTPPPTKSYTVRRGDLGSRIAHRNHISYSDLITANPNKNLDRLKPGDVLNVQRMPLLLTVRVRKTLVTTEKVHPGAPAAQAGSQRVTYQVTYLNGQETRREAQSVDILEKPLTRMDL